MQKTAMRHSLIIQPQMSAAVWPDSTASTLHETFDKVSLHPCRCAHKMRSLMSLTVCHLSLSLPHRCTFQAVLQLCKLPSNVLSSVCRR